MERKKAEPKTPHFLSLNQDIVAGPQEGNCGLKYDMLTLGWLTGQEKAEPKLRLPSKRRERGSDSWGATGHYIPPPHEIHRSSPVLKLQTCHGDKGEVSPFSQKRPMQLVLFFVH